MTQFAAGQPIVERLANLRNRVRLLLTLHGVGLVASAFLGTLMVLVALDYFLHFDSSILRLTIGLLALGCLGVLFFRQMVRPLSTRLTEQFLASRVENVSEGLADELIAAVDFVRHNTAQSNALAAKAVEAAEARAKGVRFEDALDFRPAARRFLLAVALIIVVALVKLGAPGFANTALTRWFAPMAKADWPKVMHVEFLWDKTATHEKPGVLPQGESVEIRALVKGPNAMNRRVFLYRSTNISRESYQLMQCQTGESKDDAAVYALQIQPEDAKTLSLRVEAVDDKTDDVEMGLARRPGVKELTVKVTPPDYVMENADLPPVNLLTQRATAVELSHLKFTVRSSNPLGVNEMGQPDVRFLDLAKETPLELGYSATFASGDRTVADVTMEASVSLAARVQVRDANGFVNQSGGSMLLDVVKDAMPTVSIEKPRGTQRLVPNAIPHVQTQATDDLGVAEGKWRIENFDQKPGDAPRSETAMPWMSRTRDQGGNTVAVTDFDWKLESLGLKAGDRITVFALARDNYVVAGKQHEWAKSSGLTVTIISPEEAIKDAIAQLMDAKARIEALRGQTEKTEAQVKALKETIAKAGQASAEQSRQLAELGSQQAQQAANAKGLAEKFAQIAQSLEVNQLAANDVAKMAEAAKGSMNDVSQTNMNKAASELGKASEAAGKSAESKPDQKSKAAAEASGAAGNAEQEQKQAVEKMDALVADLNKFDGLNTTRQELAGLIKDQKDVENEIGKMDASKKPEDLTKEEQKKIADLKAKQTDLRNKTAALQDKMDAMGKQSTDEAEKAALNNAVKAGKDAEVTQNQDKAAGEIGKNQADNAGESAAQASAGLQKMKDELDQISLRQLEALSQQLGDLIKLLQAHKTDETTLQDGTTKAGEKATSTALRPLGDDQGRLHLMTISTEKKAETVRQAKDAVPFIKDATDKMQAAAVALMKGTQPEALDPEGDAIAALDSAIKALEKVKAPIDEQLKDKDLAYFIKKYEEFKAAEVQIKKSSDGIKPNAEGKIGNLDSKLMARLQEAQVKVMGQLSDLNKDDKLKEYDAVLFINGQILGFMDASQLKLSKAQVGRELAWNQQKAIDRLDDIIAALQEEKAKKEDFDNPSGSGEGGGGKPPLIPAAQQLKLLKMMQLGVNKDTVEANGEMTAAASDAEKHAVGEQVQKLGETQGKIHEVAQKVMDKLK